RAPQAGKDFRQGTAGALFLGHPAFQLRGVHHFACLVVHRPLFGRDDGSVMPDNPPILVADLDRFEDAAKVNLHRVIGGDVSHDSSPDPSSINPRYLPDSRPTASAPRRRTPSAARGTPPCRSRSRSAPPRPPPTGRAACSKRSDPR